MMAVQRLDPKPGNPRKSPNSACGETWGPEIEHWNSRTSGKVVRSCRRRGGPAIRRRWGPQHQGVPTIDDAVGFSPVMLLLNFHAALSAQTKFQHKPAKVNIFPARAPNNLASRLDSVRLRL